VYLSHFYLFYASCTLHQNRETSFAYFGCAEKARLFYRKKMPVWNDVGQYEGIPHTAKKMRCNAKKITLCHYEITPLYSGNIPLYEKIILHKKKANIVYFNQRYTLLLQH
jgi:hypothetical protein